MKWISVKDKLPTNDVVLVYTVEGEIALAWYENGNWQIQPVYSVGYQSRSFVTHWMPLPKAPRKREDVPRSITINVYDGWNKDMHELASLVIEMIGSAYREERKNGRNC